MPGLFSCWSNGPLAACFGEHRRRRAKGEKRFVRDVEVVALAAAKFKRALNHNGADARPFHVWIQDQHELNELACVKGHYFVLDMFKGIDVLGTKDEAGVPNWRKVDHFPVYGMAQPTRPALERVVTRLLSEGAKRIISVSMREEPALCVGPEGLVYSPRNPDHVIENLVDTGITAPELERKERALKEELLSKAARNGGRAVCFHAVFPEVDPEEPHHVHVGQDGIHTIREMYEAQMARTPQLHFERVPVTDERAPEEQDFDQLCGILRAAPAEGTAFVLNCQMGRGRTTTAMVVTVMVLVARGMHAPHHSGAKTQADVHPAVERLVAALPDGQAAQHALDAAIDACSRMQNIRDVIWKARSDAEHKHTAAERDFWMKRARDFLERYLYLICFQAYLREEAPLGWRCSFVSWMDSRENLRDIIEEARV
eukprot:tig00021073_g18018.t1